MKYIFDEDLDIDIVDRILKLNAVTKDSLDVTNFFVDYNLDVLNNFKAKLDSQKESRFLIVGDYDCDGICATTIIKKLFDDLKIENNYYIPSRSKQGYGLNDEIVLNAYNNNFDCILCVDNGIVAIEPLNKAKQLGLKTFVIDHHEYSEEPPCDAYLHPDIFPQEYAKMCASGLCALLSNSYRYDDLTTVYGGLATLADMVDIFNYNRYLVIKMLEILKNNYIEPINLLLGRNEINYLNLQFNVIPKINAVSRLDDIMNVNYVVRFLLSKGEECLKYFDKIEIINNARKDYSKQMTALATRLLDESKNIVVVASDEFKEGLCGLVANKLLDVVNKPVIVLSKADGMFKGSGRSVAGFNIYEYLKGCDDLFDAFGGHELAIGVSIKEENFPKLLEYVDSHEVDVKEDAKQVLLINSDNIDLSFLDRISELEPFGTGFKEPLFAIKNNKYKNIVVAGKYPKFFINDSLSAISFNSKFVNKDFSYMIGRIKKDDYKGNCLSFVIEDLV